MVYVYDTTLRDGAQTPHLNLSLDGKLRITELLHNLGVPYIEGGFVGSNPRDEAYFREVMERRRGGYLPNSKIAAFGMTAKSTDVENDPYLKVLTETDADVFTIVGKSHKDQVREVLKHSPSRYLEIVRSSIDFLKSTGKEVFFDAEHFFDGYRNDPDYAMRVLEAAKHADSIVLCDTNGGTWPDDIHDVTYQVRQEFSVPLGIHCHNDRELAVANSMAAVKAGAEQVQAAVNGLGERAGNANTNSLLANLKLMGYGAISDSELRHLTRIATEVGRVTGRRVPRNMPYVGSEAFYHTGGLHADAMVKMPGSYEHIEPEIVGNKRYFVLSEQSGKAAVNWWIDKFRFEVTSHELSSLMKHVNEIQNLGEAQIYLLFVKELNLAARPFEIVNGTVSDTFDGYPEATIKVRVNGNEYHEVSVGDGPVNALDLALRKVLMKEHPAVGKLELVDYNVELPAGEHGTEARVDVSITFRYNGSEFESRATDSDIFKASRRAVEDGYAYYLIQQ